MIYAVALPWSESPMASNTYTIPPFLMKLHSMWADTIELDRDLEISCTYYRGINALSDLGLPPHSYKNCLNELLTSLVCGKTLCSSVVHTAASIRTFDQSPQIESHNYLAT
jgi:hypothetical protein